MPKVKFVNFKINEGAQTVIALDSKGRLWTRAHGTLWRLLEAPEEPAPSHSQPPDEEL